VKHGRESTARAAQADASVYTQCPQCQTLYRVTAELLRAARGQVQCGRCAEVFDALTFLVEDDAVEHAGRGPASDNTQATSRDDIPDQALEFSLPPEAIGRVFVEAPRVSLPEFPSVAVLDDDDVVVLATADSEVEVDIPLGEEPPEVAGGESEETASPPDEEIEEAILPTLGEEALAGESVEGEPAIDEASARETATWGLASESGADEAPSATGPQIRILESADATHIELVDAGEPANEDRLHSEPGARRLPIAEADASDDESELGDTAVLRHRITRIGWGAGIAVLAAFLLAQLVHYNRHELVRRPTIGPLLERLYATLGLELSPNWNLKAYEVRQWGAAAAPGAQGTLRVRASVVNTADHAQPLPLLRLSLADLAGARVGVRDFEPQEYVPNLAASQRMLGAGRRIDAEVVIVDPGKDAVGFEIDVCLRDDEHRVHCANDPAPAG